MHSPARASDKQYIIDCLDIIKTAVESYCLLLVSVLRLVNSSLHNSVVFILPCVCLLSMRKHYKNAVSQTASFPCTILYNTGLNMIASRAEMLHIIVYNENYII